MEDGRGSHLLDHLLVEVQVDLELEVRGELLRDRLDVDALGHLNAIITHAERRAVTAGLGSGRASGRSGAVCEPLMITEKANSTYDEILERRFGGRLWKRANSLISSIRLR